MIRPSSKSACSKLKLIPFFRDVIRHFELLCRLTMDFRPQTSVIFSPFPVSPVALLFLLPVCDSPFLFPILCCLVLHSPFSVLRFPFSVLPYTVHKSPYMKNNSSKCCSAEYGFLAESGHQGKRNTGQCQLGIDNKSRRVRNDTSYSWQKSKATIDEQPIDLKNFSMAQNAYCSRDFYLHYRKKYRSVILVENLCSFLHREYCARVTVVVIVSF